MQQAINTFIGGIASDSTPVSSSPQTLTDALNATLISNKGDQVEYQSLKSNVPILNSKRVQYVSTTPIEDVPVDSEKPLASIDIAANDELPPGCEVLVYVKYLGIDVPEGYTYSGIEFRPGMFINVPYDPTKTVEYVRVTPQIPSVVPGTLVYYSKVYSEESSRNDCDPDSDGSTVSFTSIVNQFYSLVSQEDADDKAITWVQAGKQDYANNRGVCVLKPVFWNEEQSAIRTKNDCEEGATGSEVTFVVEANTFSSYVDQTSANRLALDAANAGAQDYANANGTCIRPTLTLTFTSTNADNIGGNNGTATVTVAGGVGNYSYSWSNLQTTSGSPSASNTATGLSGGTSYTVTVIDGNGDTVTASILIGQSTFVFDADYMVLTYQFTDGSDLDTRTRIVSPNVGQTEQIDYLGWGRQPSWPNEAPYYLIWGGDNTGTGYEAVLIDLVKFREQYPEETQVIVDARAFWYGTVGVQPVNVEATLYKGGEMIAQGPEGTPAHSFTNPTADATYIISSVSKVVTAASRENTFSGERIATLTYNLTTNTGVLDNNDTVTPSI